MSKLLRVPKLSANENDAEVVNWLVADGTLVKAGQEVVEIATSKAVAVLTVEEAGYLHILVQKNQWCDIGSALAEISPSPQPAKDTRNQQTPLATADKRFSNAARQLMMEGSPENPATSHALVTKGDLARGISSRSELETMMKSPPQGLRSESLPREKMAQIYALEAGQAGTVNTALTVQFLAQPLMDKIVQAKKQPGLFLAILLEVLAKNVAQNPRFTSFYREGQIHYYEQANMGYAMNLEGSLKVAVIPEAQKLSAEELQKKLFILTAKYLQNKLTPEDIEGATYTVSCLLPENILVFQPLINHFQSVTIGIGGDSSLPGYPVTVTATYDHRVFNGVDVAKFLNKIKIEVQNYVI